MNTGGNLQYLRRLHGGMTQEELAEKLNISRQTISKWETGSAQPEIDKAIELCGIFNCSLDDLFRKDMTKRGQSYSDLRVEVVEAFRYVSYTVISADPESDAIGRVRKYAADNGIEHPKVIGLDFPFVSQEQINVHKLHGYTAMWVLPDGMEPKGLEIRSQPKHKYAAIHIEQPFVDPFATIPGAYRTLDDYMRVNGLVHVEDGIIPCFETDGETMDVYIACK